MKCRHCSASISHKFINLGNAPPSNAYLSTSDLYKPEIYYPLEVRVCENCWLVQTIDFINEKGIFKSDYAYFSSTSTTWLKHAKKYTSKIIELLKLNNESLVIEIASNDGYLLQNFMNEGIPCLGIEPTASTAKVAETKGIKVIHEFFTASLGNKLAKSGRGGDLIVGNNVYAHVPDINDFTRGLKAALNPNGTITLEFPHLLQLIQKNQFDTVYHEHFSYLSLYTVVNIFKKEGLRVWDVEELSTHGGSLRIYGCHSNDERKNSIKVTTIINKEKKLGLQEINGYVSLQEKAESIKNELLQFLIEQKVKNKKVYAYGAAAKGNTLLNFAGIKPDLLYCIFDSAEAKQGKFMPGSHIPIYSPEIIDKLIPDYLLILPWNIAEEIVNKYSWLRQHGTKFITIIPTLKYI